MSRLSLTWQIAEHEACQELKQFLKMHHISKRALADIKFRGGTILVNGREKTVRYVLRTGDEVSVIFPKETPSRSLQPENIPFERVYEDESVLVANKPASMNTIPSREHPSGSLANAVMGYYRENGIESAIHIVTRLDRNTSGLVLIAKNRYVHYLFSLMQQNRRIRRTYEALAEGIFTEKSGTVEAPIGRKDTSIIEREVREDGQFARTHFEVVRQYPAFAHVKLRLDTGRTHQIRVHLSYIGHPLVGDELYGGSTALYPRQALHCSALRFEHPVSGREMSFHLEPPFLGIL
ncbi:RluA family pseudouridine synthase [Weizmannia acidilactici]|uniref:RluA family pseudouridine synthase n=1 Tax=Weizmannia acidilactici TaxID=2607726 RepID=UPI00124C8C14|nr:RluA family pseudouridine synthase [Weizmannia acidilactici]